MDTAATDKVPATTPVCYRCGNPIYQAEDQLWRHLVVACDPVSGLALCDTYTHPAFIPELVPAPPEGQTAVCPTCRYRTQWDSSRQLWIHEPAAFLAATMRGCDYTTPPSQFWLSAA